MEFEWDPAKARTNLRRHGVAFPDAVGAFDDQYALTRPDPHPTEERLVTLGRDFLDRVIAVAWTWRGESIRLISARRATPRERRQYAEDANA
jgi:uncharacterized DUF497 family protein